MSNPIQIIEKTETYENYGHPRDGQKILKVMVCEICPWTGPDVIKSFGGMFDQDDSQVRADAMQYYKNQALADMDHYNAYLASCAIYDESVNED